MEIRPGRIADFAAISQVELSAGTLFEGTHMAWAVGDTTPLSILREAVENQALWVAGVDAEIAGFLLAEAIDSDFHLREVAVSRAYQGCGIGRALVETAVAEAARRGLAAVTLTTDRTLPWNAPWYEKQGFAILSGGAVPPRLAKQLAAETEPQHRCAMRRAVVQP
jgi:ribosomal protein S18 acetylase RimI-like enzyme